MPALVARWLLGQAHPAETSCCSARARLGRPPRRRRKWPHARGRFGVLRHRVVTRADDQLRDEAWRRTRLLSDSIGSGRCDDVAASARERFALVDQLAEVWLHVGVAAGRLVANPRGIERDVRLQLLQGGLGLPAVRHRAALLLRPGSQLQASRAPPYLSTRGVSISPVVGPDLFGAAASETLAGVDGLAADRKSGHRLVCRLKSGPRSTIVDHCRRPSSKWRHRQCEPKEC
jgi:hypothetical protein